MSAPPLDDLPGYRRRFRVTAGDGWVRSDLEDDFHHMHVTVRHADGVATAVEPVVVRAPWNTCPGAAVELQRTFVGARLQEFPQNARKTSNCTHLFDLALLAAAHTGDPEPLQYDVLVSDPVDGRRRAELRRNGEPAMSWLEQDGVFVEPPGLAGMTLTKMRPWLDSLPDDDQEGARILRWGTMVAHGRMIPMADQSDATRMPPNCFTFQPHVAAQAVRVGEIRDFSAEAQAPLEPRRPTAVTPAAKSQPTATP